MAQKTLQILPMNPLCLQSCIQASHLELLLHALQLENAMVGSSCSLCDVTLLSSVGCLLTARKLPDMLLLRLGRVCKLCSDPAGEKAGFTNKISAAAQVGREHVAKIPYAGAVSEKIIRVRQNAVFHYFLGTHLQLQ